MSIPYTNSPEYVIPSAAVSVTMHPSGSAWVSGAWVAITASMPRTGMLTGITYRPSVDQVHFEIDIGIGAAASEVVIATLKGYSYRIVGNSGDTAQHIPLPIPIRGLTSGSRISARLRLSTTSANDWTIAATYLPYPLSGRLQSTAGALHAAPSAANLKTLTAGAHAWVNGSYVDVYTPTSDIAICHVICAPLTNHDYEFMVDIAVGPSQNIIASLRMVGRYSSGPWLIPLPTPFKVFSGFTVAMRVRTDGEFPYDFGQFAAGFNYYGLPL